MPAFPQVPNASAGVVGQERGGRCPERTLRSARGRGRTGLFREVACWGLDRRVRLVEPVSHPPHPASRLFLLFSCLGWFGLEVEGWATLHGPLMPSSQRSGSDSEAVFQELLFHCEMCPHSRAVPAGARGCPHLSFQTVC